ncbi:MAG: hypothetical protein AAFX81_18500 [Pseudomonadota bacterium]
MGVGSLPRGHAGAARYDAPHGLLPLAFVIVVPTIVLGAVVLQPWIPPDVLLRDPLAVGVATGECCPPYYGAISNLGVLIWAAAASVGLFTALVLGSLGRWSALSFPLASGLLTGLLTLDDLYMLHDRVLPYLGVPEHVVYGVYGLLALAYLLRFHGELRAGSLPILLIAVAAFAASVLLDQLPQVSDTHHVLIEDGAKFAGIVAWAVYQIEVMLRLLSRVRWSGALTR